MALSEAEVRWRRAFLQSLQARSMRGTTFIVSDDHAGLKAARRAVLRAAIWQRLAQNAVHHGPNNDITKRIGKQLRAVWNASSLQAAEAELAILVTSYRDKHPDFADWLEYNVPKGLAVFSLPEANLKRDRTAHPAGTQAAYIQGQGLSKPRLPGTPFNRSTRRDQQKMAIRN